MIFFLSVSEILMDKYTKLHFLYPAMLVWVIAKMSRELCEDIYTLIFTRCILGIAAAFVSVGVNILVGEYYALGVGRRERALNLQGFVMALWRIDFSDDKWIFSTICVAICLFSLW